MPIEFDIVVEDEEVEEFLEEYATIKEGVEKILEKYPIARTRGFGAIAAVFLYYWHNHPKQMIRLAQAIYELAKKRKRIKVVKEEDENGNERKKLIPMVLKGEDLELFLNAVRGLTNPEDILRNRRHIQNDEGKYKPPEEDEEAARRKEELVRKAIAKMKYGGFEF